jgi:hypothetical protein
LYDPTTAAPLGNSGAAYILSAQGVESKRRIASPGENLPHHLDLPILPRNGVKSAMPPDGPALWVRIPILTPALSGLES